MYIENTYRVLCIKISLHFYVDVNPNTNAATISVPCHGPLLYINGFSKFILVSKLGYEK